MIGEISPLPEQINFVTWYQSELQNLLQASPACLSLPPTSHHVNKPLMHDACAVGVGLLQSSMHATSDLTSLVKRSVGGTHGLKSMASQALGSPALFPASPGVRCAIRRCCCLRAGKQAAQQQR